MGTLGVHLTFFFLVGMYYSVWRTEMGGGGRTVFSYERAKELKFVNIFDAVTGGLKNGLYQLFFKVSPPPMGGNAMVLLTFL